MKGEEIRKIFLDFFKKKKHIIKESAPLVPKDDPTLLFTGAGMNQFKKEFLGIGDPELKRVATCQVCFRTSDIEMVGQTGRHHTFFEMLGNFSFGDYFKEEAIAWAWEFVREVFRIPEEKIWITIYREDEEAFYIWRDKIGVKEERIVSMGEDTNFWSMGPTGPCGPCSEIIVDRGEEYGCGKETCGVGCECDRFLELWNLVFTQFDRQKDGTLNPLPQKNIDTGMGLERAACLMQRVEDNFLTDLLFPIIKKTEILSHKKYQGDSKIPLRIIADHIRGITFLLSEGVLPSNEGRGYVLRRLIRRGITWGKNLGLQPPFLYQLVPVVIEIMGETYPEVRVKREHIIQVLVSEEKSFARTLEEGMEMLEGMLKEKRILSGKEVFRLYDTFGFPPELTEEVAAKKGVVVDMEGFEREMELQREKGREAWRKEERSLPTLRKVYEKVKSKAGEIPFLGYQTLNTQAKVISLIKEGKEVGKVEEGEEVEIVISPTPFYAEAGGQRGDKGWIESKGGRIEVSDTYYGTEGLIVHQGKVVRGEIRVGEEVNAQVDENIRKCIAIHHTSTHLLQYALRQVLGKHVYQAGSYVGENGLRFDFTHFTALHPEEIKKVEEIVNEKIRQNSPVEVSFLPLEEAKRQGAIALFGEKYGEIVRMVTIGDYSKELCAGTHLSSTGEIGLFLIESESSVGAGVRRIEGVGGPVAYNKFRKEREILEELSNLLKSSPENLPLRVQEILEENKRLRREEEKIKEKLLIKEGEEILEKSQKIKGIRLVIWKLNDTPRDTMRRLIDYLKMKSGEKTLILIGGVREDKVLMVCGLTEDLVKEGWHAGKLIKEIAQVVGGSGGGKPELAEAGGKKTDKIEEALKKVYTLI